MGKRFSLERCRETGKRGKRPFSSRGKGHRDSIRAGKRL